MATLPFRRRIWVDGGRIKSPVLRCLPRYASHSFSISTRKLLEESSLPRVAQPSTWKALIPRSLRRTDESSRASRGSNVSTKEWNPATVFIVLGLLVGSNAINIIKLRNDMLNFSRKTDAKLDLLREVVERVRRGEDVDVEKELGTGDVVQEKEWEQVMKEIEETDRLAEAKKRKEAKEARKAREKQQRADEEALKRQETNGAKLSQDASAEDSSATRRPRFMM